MGKLNKTLVTEFILLAFSDLKEMQMVLFIIILLAYLVCVSGNITIIYLVRVERTLHVPMYLFLSTFAFAEILFVSVPIPKLLVNLICNDHRISLYGCFAQVYAFNALGEIECLVITIMVYDRYLAVNKPLHYTQIMKPELQLKLAMLPWGIGLILSFILTMFTASLEFCDSNVINHFFCDLGPLQSLACSNTLLCNIVTSTAAVIATIIPISMIIGMYIQLIITVSSAHGNGDKSKMFSTCSSHMIVAGLFFGTAFVVYVNPNGSRYDKFLALTYTVVTPLLNPFIYTLRNRDSEARSAGAASGTRAVCTYDGNQDWQSSSSVPAYGALPCQGPIESIYFVLGVVCGSLTGKVVQANGWSMSRAHGRAEMVGVHNLWCSELCATQEQNRRVGYEMVEVAMVLNA
ncbi:olfactory receptor 2AP1-like [Gastrophryne carolinensis]